VRIEAAGGGGGQIGGTNDKKESPSAPLLSLRVLTIAFVSVLVLAAAAQNPELQQRVGEIKLAAAENKQALAHYSWQQQQTTAIKGDVKDTRLF